MSSITGRRPNRSGQGARGASSLRSPVRLCAAGHQVTLEEVGGQPCRSFQLTRLLEQVGGTHHDLEAMRAAQPLGDELIQLQDRVIVAPHDEQRGRDHP